MRRIKYQVRDRTRKGARHALYNLAAEHFFHTVENVHRSVENLFYQRLPLLSRSWLHVHARLFCFIQHLRIVQSFSKSIPEEFYSFSRSARRDDHGTAKIPRGQNDLRKASTARRHVVLIEYFMSRRHVGRT